MTAKTVSSKAGSAKTKSVKTKSAPTRQKAAVAPGARLMRLPDGSRSVQSPWVWRGFLFMSLIALGLFINFATGHKLFLAAAWGFITAGWFSIAMWLWRKHVREDDEWYARQRAGRKA